MNNPHIDIEEEAMDIIQQDDLTQQQLDEIENSAELRNCVQDALDMRTVTERDAKPVDVEEALRNFKNSHRRPQLEKTLSNERPRMPFLQSNRTQIKLISSLVAVAAFLAGIIFLVDHFLPVSSDKSPYLYSAVTQSGIRLTNQNGSEATLSPNTQQNTSLTIDDFRRILDDPEEVRELTLTIPVGKSADFTLSDSTKVYLAPGSRLTFPSTFSSDKRVVKLDGMGYFKVRHDASRPFTVLTDKTATTVLGTEFMVDSHNSNISLVSGKVSARSLNGESRAVIIRPDEMVHFGSDGKARLSEIDTTPLKAWRDGYLYFDNVELRDIMLAIGANFNKNVEFRSHRAEHYRMKFITERNKGVAAAIDMMNRMEKVTVTLHGNTIIVDDFHEK
jgi:transmembrane sensor